MKYAPLAASIMLGLLFIMTACMFFFNLMPAQEIPKDSAQEHFMAAFGPTGYMKFVKVFELLGGLLLLVPKTRNLGLLCIGPVLVNILAYHAFVMKGVGLLNPMLIVICLLALFLLWSERKSWAALIH
jgi:putative oxidoreductase